MIFGYLFSWILHKTKDGSSHILLHVLQLHKGIHTWLLSIWLHISGNYTSTPQIQILRFNNIHVLTPYHTKHIKRSTTATIYIIIIKYMCAQYIYSWFNMTVILLQSNNIYTSYYITARCNNLWLSTPWSVKQWTMW